MVELKFEGILNGDNNKKTFREYKKVVNSIEDNKLLLQEVIQTKPIVLPCN